MEEFAKLFFTGKRAESYARFCHTAMAFGVAASACALLSLILSFAGVTLAALTVTLSALGLAAGAVSGGMNVLRPRYVSELAARQEAANALELRGEEGERASKVYQAYKEAFGGRKRWKFILAGIFSTLSVGGIFAATLLASFGISEGVVLPICGVATVCLMAGAVLRALAEMGENATFYGLASAEIDEIKRTRLGYSEERIAIEGERKVTPSSLPKSVECFLKEQTERNDFAALTKRNGLFGFALGFGIGVLCFGSEILGAILPSETVWALVNIALLVMIALSVLLTVKDMQGKREIYLRNAEKFREGREDELRGELQNAWIRLQRGGNFLFGGVTLLAVLCAAGIGLFGYVIHAEAVVETAGICFVMSTVIGAIVSFIIWGIVYAVYRRRVRPLEIELKKIQRKEP